MHGPIAVRMLRDKTVDGVFYKAGDVVELSGTAAAVCLQRGIAERAEFASGGVVTKPTLAVFGGTTMIEGALPSSEAVEEVVEVMEAAEPDPPPADIQWGSEDPSPEVPEPQVEPVPLAPLNEGAHPPRGDEEEEIEHASASE